MGVNIRRLGMNKVKLTSRFVMIVLVFLGLSLGIYSCGTTSSDDSSSSYGGGASSGTTVNAQ